MSKYGHHKYTRSKPFGTAKHNWSLVGPIGAVSFHAAIYDGIPSCGLEFHHTAASGYRADEAPDHMDCPLTGGPCWHDGTSLYAIEELWPEISAYLGRGDHETIFSVLEHEANKHFDALISEARGEA